MGTANDPTSSPAAVPPFCNASIGALKKTTVEEAPQSPGRHRRRRKPDLECWSADETAKRVAKQPYSIEANIEEGEQDNTSPSSQPGSTETFNEFASHRDQSVAQAVLSQTERVLAGARTLEKEPEDPGGDSRPRACLADTSEASNHPHAQVNPTAEPTGLIDGTLVGAEGEEAAPSELQENELGGVEIPEENYDADVEPEDEDEIAEVIHSAHFSNFDNHDDVNGAPYGFQDTAELDEAYPGPQNGDESGSDGPPACQHSRQVDRWFAENVNVSESTIATVADRQEVADVADDEDQAVEQPRVA